MESFIFALNAVAPIILTVVLGYFLKKIGLFKEDFAKATNRLVFRVFLPVMLFLNVYNIESISDINLGYVLYAVVFILAVIVLSFVFIPIIVKKNERRAPLIQAIFRSNYALIGIPLAESLFGAEGAMVAAVMSAFTIPLFNIFGVVCFTVFSNDGKKPNFKNVVSEIVKNPLIVGIAVGAIFLLLKSLLANAGVTTTLSDITPIYKLLTYLSNMATPLALLTLGAQFEFSTVPELKREIILATILRCVAVPAAALALACLTDKFSGAHFAAFVALFATPVAVSTVPMAQELKGDARLAGQLVVWTTLVSGFTIFLFTFLLKEIGVFV